MTIRIFNADFQVNKERGMVFLRHPRYSLSGCGKDLVQAGIDLEYEGKKAKGAMLNNCNPKFSEYKRYLIDNF